MKKSTKFYLLLFTITSIFSGFIIFILDEYFDIWLDFGDGDLVLIEVFSIGLFVNLCVYFYRNYLR